MLSQNRSEVDHRDDNVRKKRAKEKPKDRMCLLNILHKSCILTKPWREKRIPSLTGLFVYVSLCLFIYLSLLLSCHTAGGARDHRCWGESDGHPQFIIHTPVTAGQAEIWHGKHEP